MEGVKGWAGDEGGLVRDPKVLDGVVGVDKDDALKGFSRVRQDFREHLMPSFGLVVVS